MFAATGVYHRYFSHRTYKTSRPMQFLLAVLAQTTSQKGILWWAAHHRAHHRNSDTPRDVHSPLQFGFWHAHVGWIYDGTASTDYARVRDFTRFPELVILNKLWWIPPAGLAFAVWAIWGWSGLWIGFMLSTVLVWHAVFTINSLAHVWGTQRYDTSDTSRNNWVLALLTMGEGWHNNHHHFMGSARQGFYWWEIDATYYILRAMSWFGLVWDLKPPSPRVYTEQRRAAGRELGARGSPPTAASPSGSS
jgi:stearoyl-CoA desaturase (delta-9 desaturase)